MGEVKVGDHLLGADGRPTTVIAAFEVMYGRPCYEVEFSDGSGHRRRRRAPVEDHDAGEPPPDRASSPAGTGRDRSLAKVRAAHAAVGEDPDRLVTLAQTLGQVGDDVPATSCTPSRGRSATNGRITRPVTRAGKARNWTAPGYPAGPLLTGLLDRAERQGNAGVRVRHDGVVTTAEIAATLRTDTADRRLNHAVENARRSNCRSVTCRSRPTPSACGWGTDTPGRAGSPRPIPK